MIFLFSFFGVCGKFNLVDGYICIFNGYTSQPSIHISFALSHVSIFSPYYHSCIPQWIRKQTIGSKMSCSLSFHFTRAPLLPFNQSRNPSGCIISKLKTPQPSNIKVHITSIPWHFSLQCFKKSPDFVLDSLFHGRHKIRLTQSPSRTLVRQFPTWQFMLEHFWPR